jgi:glutathione S-transferase
MRLYYHPFSTNARRAVITAIELAAPVELVLVDLVKVGSTLLPLPSLLRFAGTQSGLVS